MRFALAAAALALVGSPLRPVVAQPLPRLTPVSTVGCDECAGPLSFPEIMDVAVTDSGSVLVVTTGEPMLRRLDRAGKVVWTAGRKGAGPGEFRLPFRAVGSAQGWSVVDMTQRRISWFGADGAFVRSELTGGFTSAASPRGRTGEFVTMTDNFRGTLSLRRWTAAGSAKDVGTVPPPPPADSGLTTTPSIAVAPSGEIAVLRNPERYLIVRMGADGEVIGTISRDVPRVRRTPQEIEALQRRQARAAALRQAEGRGRAPILPPRAGTPEVKPHIAIDGIRFDDRGRLWVRTMRGDDTHTVFDLFDTAGRFMGELSVPMKIGAFAFAGRWMAAATESEFGAPTVTLFEVR